MGLTESLSAFGNILCVASDGYLDTAVCVSAVSEPINLGNEEGRRQS